MATKRLNKAHICGPGLSICCSVISIWGVIMLAIVGGLLTIKSAAFLEDLVFEEGNGTTFEESLDHAYKAAATNCYAAAGLYAGCFIFCAIQVIFNIKASSMKQ